MAEREQPEFLDERFATLAAVQEALSHRGYTFLPIPKEHTEALVTDPLLHRIHTQVKKRGFANVAGKAIVTFSGYGRDPREISAIPEIRGFWQHLDTQLPELPALLAYLPTLRFNGPGIHLMLLGEIDAVQERPAEGMYDVHVVDAPHLITDATRRIRQAGQKYHLDQSAVTRLLGHFLQGAGSQP